MSTKLLVKNLIRGNVALTCAAYLAHDWYVGLRVRQGRIDSESGTFSRDFGVDRAIDYVENVHRPLLSEAGVTRFGGAVAEIGPGDNLGMALLLRARGAESWHGIDRFRPNRDLAHENAIHRALAERLGRPDLLRNGGQDVDGAYYHTGVATETFFHGNGLRFDVILSSAAPEHVIDPIQALDDMVRALRPGGIMVHRIDLRDHGMFELRHPLTFLTVPEPIYHRMVHNAGRPNRIMMGDYRLWAASCGASAEILPFWMVGATRDAWPITEETRARALAEVAAKRRRFAGRLAQQEDGDLAVAGFALIVRKSA